MFEVAQRTGRTLGELQYGGPSCYPMEAGEFVQWVALITVVEPYEQEQAQQKNKGRR